MNSELKKLCTQSYDEEYFENKVFCHIESLFIFCMVWSYGNFLSRNERDRFSEFIIQKIKEYRQILEFKLKSDFGFNFFEIIDKSGFRLNFNLYFIYFLPYSIFRSKSNNTI